MLNKGKKTINNGKIVVFDFDRTIVDLNVNWPLVRQKVFDFCFNSGIVIDKKKPLYESIKNTSDTLLEKSRNKKLVDKFRKDSFAIIRREELVALRGAKLIDGAKEFLEWLSQTKIKFAILSNNNSQCVVKVFKKFHLAEPVIIIGSDNVKYLKPHPEGINKILEKMNKNSSQCILIGDSRAELDLGNALGIKTFILTAYYKSKKENCDLSGNLIENFNQLKEIFV